MPSNALHIGARVATGILAVGGAAALVLGAAILPPPAVATAGTETTPAAVDQNRACPGPLLRLGDVTGGTAITSYGSADVAAGTLAAPGGAVTGLHDVDVAAAHGGSSTVWTVPSATGADTLLAAAQVQVAAETDATGLAAITCGEGAATSWLLAGATDTGRSSMLLLANPNRVAATVALSLYTAKGPVQAPGLGDIVVPPLSQRALSLAGYAPGASQLAVEVRSRGGLVSAALEETIVRGLEPGGVDLVGRTAAAATAQTIPGVRVTTSAATAARAQVGGSQDVQTVVRLLAPLTDAVVTIGVVPEAAGGTGTSLSVEANAGTVLDVPLGTLADGTYTVTIASTEPVLAGARVSTVAPPDPHAATATKKKSSSTVVLDGGGGGSVGYDVVGPAVAGANVQMGERIDLAWLTAVDPITSPIAFATARGPSPRLALANPGDAAVSVILKGGGGEQTVEVPARAGIGVGLKPGAVYLLTGTGAVVGSVSYAGDGQLAAHPLRPASPLATPLTVYH